jgi:hypothetical protein
MRLEGGDLVVDLSPQGELGLQKRTFHDTIKAH